MMAIEDIWTHLTGGSVEELSAEAAEEILRLRFDVPVQDRVDELAAKASDGTLDESSRIELERYLDAASLLGVLQIRARSALRRRIGQKAS